MNRWRIFLWAAVHHRDFKYCAVLPPISLRDFWCEETPSKELTLEIRLRAPFSLYIPYAVENAYEAWLKTHKPPRLDDNYDDIPF